MEGGLRGRKQKEFAYSAWGLMARIRGGIVWIVEGVWRTLIVGQA